MYLLFLINTYCICIKKIYNFFKKYYYSYYCNYFNYINYNNFIILLKIENFNIYLN
jgi:hypothetical protein